MTKRETKIVEHMAMSAVFAYVNSSKSGRSPNKLARTNAAVNLIRCDDLLKTGDKYQLKAMDYAIEEGEQPLKTGGGKISHRG